MPSPMADLALRSLPRSSSARYFFPQHPIKVSPISIREFFSQWGGAVIRSELKYIWLPRLSPLARGLDL